MNLTSWAWIIVPLGLTRAMQIALWDRITQRPREWLLARLNPEGYGMKDPRRSYASYALECAWCSSVWIAAAATGLLLWDATRAVTLAVLLLLALSLAMVTIDRMIDRTLPDEAPEPQPPVQVGEVHLHDQGDAWETFATSEAPPGVDQALADLAEPEDG